MANRSFSPGPGGRGVREHLSAARLDFSRMDLERQFGLRGSGNTVANTWAAAVVAFLLTILFYGVLIAIPSNFITQMFLERGPTQHACVFFGFWCAVILLVKRNKLRVQRSALEVDAVPNHHAFVLTSQTVDQVAQQLHANATNPEDFIVYNRILVATSNLKNLGRVSDVDEILQSMSNRDSNVHETSFGLINGMLWAIPVLGFIGTVLGLSISISSFSQMLDKQKEVSGIVGSLKEVTAGLSTAFETTLVALLIALGLQLWTTFQKTAEEQFLDDCDDYCMKQITSKIRILPYEEVREV